MYFLPFLLFVKESCDYYLIHPILSHSGPLMGIHGSPSDYAWGPQGLENIISQMLANLEDDGPPPTKKEKLDTLPVVQATKEELIECKGNCVRQPPLLCYSQISIFSVQRYYPACMLCGIWYRFGVDCKRRDIQS